MNTPTKLFFTNSLFLLSTICLAKEPKTPNFEASEVAKGLYMISGIGGFTGGNIGLSVGDDGVVMIDDSMPPLLDKLKKTIAKITPNKVDFLINTHVHGDHTGNNELMGKAGTHIVAHENLRTHLMQKGVRTGQGMKPAPKQALPVITFSKSMSFHLNSEDTVLFHVAKAHTDGDAVIHFKNSNVIHMGDTFFNGMFPYIDLDSGGSVEGYIKAQQQVLKLSNDKTKIIPGHGPLASKQDLQRSLAMLVDSTRIIKSLIEKGMSESEVINAKPLSKFHNDWNWSFITTQRMTQQLYQGLTDNKTKPHSEHGHNH